MEEHDMEHEEHRRDLIDHSGLKVLLPYLKSYAQKGLTEMRSQKKSFTASVVEIYAAGVCERVSELDNALAALRLTLGFVMDLGSQSSPSPDIYRYHYENFVLRVIGFVDRAHRLVGASLLMDKAKFETIGGNAHVQRQVRADHPDLHAALQAVEQAVESYRGPRNELIHSSAFTSRELGLFQSVRQFGLDTEGLDVDGARTTPLLSRKHRDRADHRPVGGDVDGLARCLGAALCSCSRARRWPAGKIERFRC